MQGLLFVHKEGRQKHIPAKLWENSVYRSTGTKPRLYKLLITSWLRMVAGKILKRSGESAMFLICWNFPQRAFGWIRGREQFHGTTVQPIWKYASRCGIGLMPQNHIHRKQTNYSTYLKPVAFSLSKPFRRIRQSCQRWLPHLHTFGCTIR